MREKLRPLLGKRKKGRRQTRWYEYLKNTIGLNWIREEQNRDNWKSRKEAYVQFCMSEGYKEQEEAAVVSTLDNET